MFKVTNKHLQTQRAQTYKAAVTLILTWHNMIQITTKI